MKYAVLLFLFVPSAFGATVIVTMRNNVFVQPNITINVGDTVRWNNTQGFHDTVSGSRGVPDGVWNSNNQFRRLMFPGENFSFTFSSPGAYLYYCTPHWSLNMTGVVNVVSPNEPPSVSILTPANGATFTAPADVTVEASASDPNNDPLRVELFINGASLGVFTAPPYRATASNLGPGNYTLSALVTDTANATASASVSVSVVGAEPVITVPPQSQIVTNGGDAFFTVQAAGSPPLAYEWSFGSDAIPGANGPSLLVTNVTTNNAGPYTVRVSNAFGAASETAILTVTNIIVGTAPVITTHPQSQTVDPGGTVTFTAAADGTSPLTWQWFLNDSPIVGASEPFLVASNAGVYFVSVSNPFGSAVSSNATLTLCEFTLSTNEAAFGAPGGTGVVSVTGPADCAWTAVTTDPWILLAVGPGTVTFTVLPNPVPTPRHGHVLIAGNLFMITQAGAAGDFNHDGHTDFLWQHDDRRVLLWLMNSVNRVSSVALPSARPGSRIAGTHDFNLDGQEDILWQRSNGALEIWFMNGVRFVRSELIHAGPGKLWQVAGLGDFNRDTHVDLLFRHRDGYVLLWTMQGTRVLRQQMLADGKAVPPIWNIAVVADIDRDGHCDILWQHPNSSMVLWVMNGETPASSPRLSHLPRMNARIVGANDLNQDGSLDFIWRHPDGRLTAWWMNGTNRLGSFPINHGQRVAAAMHFAAPRN